MTRSTGERIAAVLTFCAAVILALASLGFFAVSVMAATGDERTAPVSIAITGMAAAGGFMLLILAGAAGLVAVNVGELREWTQTVSVPTAAMEATQNLSAGFAAAIHSSKIALTTFSEKFLAVFKSKIADPLSSWITSRIERLTRRDYSHHTVKSPINPLR
jgi:hypothetical protein